MYKYVFWRLRKSGVAEYADLQEALGRWAHDFRFGAAWSPGIAGTDGTIWLPDCLSSEDKKAQYAAEVVRLSGIQPVRVFLFGVPEV